MRPINSMDIRSIDIRDTSGTHASRMYRPHPSRRLFVSLFAVAFAFLLACAPPADAQISLASAVDLAIRHNPRVKSAEADVRKANNQVSEALDAYVPTITAGAGLGQAYGYSPNPPTLATVTAGALVFNASHHFYIKSAREGLTAALLALDDVHQAVAQDTALAFITLDHDHSLLDPQRDDLR